MNGAGVDLEPQAKGAPMPPIVHGRALDPQTRCAHWHSPLDIIAIRMRCCGEYWACRSCHDELAGHPAEVWPAADGDREAVLCGACDHEMSVRAYLASGNLCPACAAPFNPGCRHHYHLYFEAAPIRGPDSAARRV